MKSSTLGRAALPAAVALALGLSACGASNESGSGTKSSASSSSGGASSSASSAAAVTGTLNGAGSTAQQAAQQAWVAGFVASNPSAQVNYDAVGSGAGVTQFTSNAVAFAGSDVALTTAQQTAAASRCGGGTAVDLPDYISPIALAYNLPGVSSLQLSPATAAKIYSGTITTWDDPAVKADNPGVSLPSMKISVVHRADKSGTTDNFTDWLNKADPADWKSAANEVWPLPGGEAAQGTSGVVSAIKAAKGSIGYADASQLGGLGAAKVKVGSTFVAPSADAAAATVTASQQAPGRPSGDIVYTINRTPTGNAYPVILVSYLVACTKYSDASTAGLVKAYLSYVTSATGQQAAAKSAGSAPIPSTLSSTEASTISSISG